MTYRMIHLDSKKEAELIERRSRYLMVELLKEEESR
jgi:hypothetical protein